MPMSVCLQCGFPTSFMPGMPGVPSMVPFMNFSSMSMRPPRDLILPAGINFPGALLPTPEELQLQQLRGQVPRRKLIKQNLEQSLEFVATAHP